MRTSMSSSQPGLLVFHRLVLLDSSEMDLAISSANLISSSVYSGGPISLMFSATASLRVLLGTLLYMPLMNSTSSSVSVMRAAPSAILIIRW